MALTAEALGARVRGLREARGLSQAAVAAVVERDRRHVSRIEHGEVRLTVDELFRLSLAFGVEPCELLEETSG